jgi:hypothetical protein
MTDENPFAGFDTGRDPEAPPTRKQQTRDRQGQFWVGLGLFLVAAAVEVLMVSLFVKALAIQSWPVVAGTITRSELKPQLPLSTSTEALIEYRYRVNDRAYTSQQVRTRGTGSKYASEVTQLLEQYPVGKEVEVHHDPADPSQAYLEVGVSFPHYIAMVPPLLFAVLGLGILGRAVWETAKVEQ